MGAAGKYRRDLPPMHVLLTGRCVARLVGDQHGVQLFTCAIDRKTKQEASR
jgi:hypothetical protein